MQIGAMFMRYQNKPQPRVSCPGGLHQLSVECVGLLGNQKVSCLVKSPNKEN